MSPSDKHPVVAVVYLVWIPYGITLFQSFVASYQKYPGGYPHQLVLLFNGMESREDAAPYHAYAATQELEYVSYYRRKGQDLEAYGWLAPQLNADYLLFLNSYSELLAVNWLLKYVQVVMKEKDTGAVGATASYESYYHSILTDHSWAWNKKTAFAVNIKKYKLLIKTILLYRFYFKTFPNPHLRTNAFFISRKVFLSVRMHVFKKKVRAYMFESGRKGLTSQLLKKNLQVLVMDKHGTYYSIPHWYQSQTFWAGSQENLLVSDNQTRKFTNAEKEEQQKLTFKAWGRYE